MSVLLILSLLDDVGRTNRLFKRIDRRLLRLYLSFELSEDQVLLLDFLSVDPEDFVGSCQCLLYLNSTLLLLVKVSFHFSEFLGKVGIGLLDHLIVGQEHLVVLTLLPI